jgi:hypothetical protein
LLFNVDLEYVIGNAQEKQEGLKLIGTYQLLVNAADNIVPEHLVARSCIHSVPGYSVFRATFYHN